MYKLLLFSLILCFPSLAFDQKTQSGNVDNVITKVVSLRIGNYEVGSENASTPFTTADLTSHAFSINDSSVKIVKEASCISDSGDQIVTIKIGATIVFSIHCVTTGVYDPNITDGSTGYVEGSYILSNTVVAHAQLDLSGTANGITKDIKLHIYGNVP